MSTISIDRTIDDRECNRRQRNYKDRETISSFFSCYCWASIDQEKERNGKTALPTIIQFFTSPPPHLLQLSVLHFIEHVNRRSKFELKSDECGQLYRSRTDVLQSNCKVSVCVSRFLSVVSSSHTFRPLTLRREREKEIEIESNGLAKRNGIIHTHTHSR